MLVEIVGFVICGCGVCILFGVGVKIRFLVFFLGCFGSGMSLGLLFWFVVLIGLILIGIGCWEMVGLREMKWF